jgi:ssDNA-binding Zn-finger/Zn-ribbon topoisomerase 1
LPIFFLLISLLGIVLVKRQFIPFMGKYSLESSDQKIHIKRTLIKCPECNSKMRIFQSNTGVYVSCERNPEQHIFPFDYTTFKDNE